MTKTPQRNNRPVEAALYYVRLKTRNNSSLFGLSNDVPDPSQPAASQANGLATSVASLSSAPFSKIAADELLLAANHRGIALDQWVIVPDAVHALVFVREHRPDYEAGAGKPRLLTSFIAGFKAATAKRINLMRNQPGSPVWQRSYDEQRVDDEFMLKRLQRRISEADGIVRSSQVLLH